LLNSTRLGPGAELLIALRVAAIAVQDRALQSQTAKALGLEVPPTR
jgi:hypothetical protein